MNHLPPFSGDPTTTTSPRVNLTTERAAVTTPTVDRKANLESQGASSPSAVSLRASADDPPATPRAGASTHQVGHRIAWHEISYRDPRKGERTLRWVKLPDAREQAKKVAARIGVEVTIWAVYRDATGRETHSAFVEVVR